MRHFSGIKINSQTSSWSHFINFRRGVLGMYVDQEFLIAKLRVHTLCEEEKRLFFFCGESEQHPKWDSFAKAAPKAIWRHNPKGGDVGGGGWEVKERQQKDFFFLICPVFWRNARCIRTDGISELVSWHLETIWGLPVIQNTPWQSCFFLKRDNLLWCTLTIFLWNSPECSTWPQELLPNRGLENVCLLKCSDLRKIFHAYRCRTFVLC